MPLGDEGRSDGRADSSTVHAANCSAAGPVMRFSRPAGGRL